MSLPSGGDPERRSPILPMRVLRVAFCFAALCTSGSAQTLYWNTNGTSASWTAANWSSVSTGPFTTAWTNSSNVQFTADASITYVTNTPIGNVTLDSGVTVGVTAAGTMSTGGNVRTFDIGSGATLNWTGQSVSTASGTGFVKNGSGAWNMGAGGSYTGGFTLNAGSVSGTGANSFGAGTLTLNGGTLSSSNNNSTFAVTAIVVGGNFSVGGTGNSTFSAPVNLGASSRVITNSISAGSRTFSGAISGNTGAGLTLTGSGATILSGNSTYTGGTTITGGAVTAAHNNAFGTGAVSLSGGTLAVNTGITIPNSIALGSAGTLSGSGTAAITGTISGTGTLGGTITIASGGTVSPGNSPGILSVATGATLTFATGSTYTWELASLTTSGAGTSFDQIALLGTATVVTNGVSLVPAFGTNMAPNQGDSFWNSAQTWNVVAGSGTSTITGTFAVNNSTWSSIGTFATSLVAGNLVLGWTPSPTAVPEPSTYAALAGALALAAALGRRRSRTPLAPAPDLSAISVQPPDPAA